MKAVWISLILFAFLISGMLINTVYMRGIAERLEQISVALEDPKERDHALNDLETFWSNDRKRIGLTVGYKELDHFGEILVQLRWAWDANNEEEFERYRRLLTDATEELIRTEIWQ